MHNLFVAALHETAIKHFQWWWILIIVCSLGLAALAKWLNKKHHEQEHDQE
jgi:hypothetical protein